MTRPRTISAGRCRGLVVQIRIGPSEPLEWVTVTSVRQSVSGDFVRLAFVHPTGGRMSVERRRSASLVLHPDQRLPGDPDPIPEGPALF